MQSTVTSVSTVFAQPISNTSRYTILRFFQRSPLDKPKMAKVTDDSIQINVPFALPALGMPEPTTISINKANFQFAVRLIVGICAFLLFWPKIKGAFGIAPRDMEAETKDIQERIAKLEHERNQSQGQKSYAVATGAGGARPATPVKATSGKEKGSAKRRKA